MASKPTILLVDDDPRNIFALKAVLQVNGFRIIAAKNGLECLYELEQNTDIELVLMDMMMPVMDGYETTLALRQKEAFKHLPIFAVTAQAMTGDKERCLASGADEYISKPIDTEELLVKIKTYLPQT